MALLTNAAIEGFRSYVKRTLYYAKYKLDGTYVQTTLNKVDVDSSGVVRVSFMIYPKSGSQRVTEVQLYDTDNQLWLTKPVNLKMDSVAEGFYELVKFRIVEVDDE